MKPVSGQFEARKEEFWFGRKKRAVSCYARAARSALLAVSSQRRQKKRIVLVAILACSSSEQPALVATPVAASVGFTRSLLSR